MKNNIPLELRQLPQWVAATADKVPVNPKTRQLASPTDPTTWGTFEQACSVGLPHVGFVLSPDDPYAIIDLDDKPSKPATPEQKLRHSRILEAFDSYTERSSSGTGYHIIVRGKVPAGVNRDNVEVYSSDRYMICTGDVVRQADIQDHQSLLLRLYGEMKPAERAELEEREEAFPDDDLFDMAMRAANGDKFDALCKGDWQAMGYTSQSEADMALLSMLAHYTLSDEQVRRIFRMSALGQREKAQKNDRYLNFTLSKIRAQQPPLVDWSAMAADWEKKLAEHQAKQPGQPFQPQPSFFDPRLEFYEQFITRKARELKLIDGLLGKGMLSVIYGPPRNGKSFIALDMAMSVATGQPWFGRPVLPGPVLYATCEGLDGVPKRVQAAAENKVGPGIRPPVAFFPHPLDVPDNWDELVTLTKQVGQYYGQPPVMVVIDTLYHYFGDGDENSSKDMRIFTKALGQYREAFPDLHVMLIHHSGKAADKGMRGSTALPGAIDTTLRVTRVDDATNGDLYVEKQKDGRDAYSIPFKLAEVEVVRFDGEEQVHSSTCIVEQNTDGKPPKLPASQQRAAVALLQLDDQVKQSGDAITFQAVLNWCIKNRKEAGGKLPAHLEKSERLSLRTALEAFSAKNIIEWQAPDEGEKMAMSEIRLLPSFRSFAII